MPFSRLSSSPAAASAVLLLAAVLSATAAQAATFGFRVRDDHVAVTAAGSRVLDVQRNDIYDTGSLVGGSLTITVAPVHGTLVVESVGSPADPVPTTKYRYTPAPDFLGVDRFTYRMCDKLGNCGSAVVELRVLKYDAMRIFARGRSGYVVKPLAVTAALPAAEFRTSTLAAAEPLVGILLPDPTPHSPWDNPDGTKWTLRTLPPVSGAPVSHRILAYEPGVSDSAAPRDVYIGIDRNRDGLPSADEVVCEDGGDFSPSCEIELEQGSDGAAYWVLLHNRAPGQILHAIQFHDMVEGGDERLTVTGPGHVVAGAGFDLMVAWNDDRLYPRSIDNYRSRVQLWADADTLVGEVDVYILMDMAGAEVPSLLIDRTPRTLTMPAGSHDRLYFDVPAGATKLTVSSASLANFDFHVAREGAAIDPASIAIGTAPALAQAAAVANGPGGNETKIVQGAALQPGRWYVVPKNMGTEVADVTLTIAIDAVAPIVRSGSYFNAARPGSGLFLYPAADQWTGLWYTYGENSRPTWYYLQAQAPGATGLWTSRIWRAAWNGSTRTLTDVGYATVTPTGHDAFTLSYVIDGVAGSQPMAALGRGCPNTGVDISSQWFDPAKTGTGYSVQMFPDYEYFAAFVYDMQGMPMFLAAENPHFGGADSTLDLQRLEGDCPTCAFRADSPRRADAGTLARTLVDGALDRVEIDALYEAPVGTNGFWTADDTVQLLGGPGTAQGCDP